MKCAFEIYSNVFTYNCSKYSPYCLTELQTDDVIKGHHVYQNIWITETKESLLVEV